MSAPLPPGRTGLPLLGETLAFMKDSFEFVASRQAEHGPVFRTHLLGRPTAVIMGPEGTRAFIDPERIQREGSMPPSVQQLFAGPSLPVLDGETHRTRKRQVLAAFTPEALGSYLPTMQARTEAHLAEWIARGPTGVVAATKRLALEIIDVDFLGVAPGEATAQMSGWFDVFSAGFSALPVPLPGTQWSRTLAARAKILAALRAAVARHRRGDVEGTTGLARILAAEVDGAKLDDDAAVLEVHHVQIAGYIVFAWMSAALIALSRNAALAAALRAEVDAAPPALDAAALRAMPALAAFVREVKRHTPVLSVSFGKARKDFEVGGYTIPAGWMVLHGLRATNVWAGSFAEPERFDPERHGRGEGADEDVVYVPQGAGPRIGHKCAGLDYATLLLTVFVATVLRKATFTLPAQDLSLDSSRIPPEPRSGLDVRFARR